MKSFATALLALPLSAFATDYQVTYEGVVNGMFYAECNSFSAGNCSAWDFTYPQSSSFVPGAAMSVGLRLTASFILDGSQLGYALSSDGTQATYFDSLRQGAASVGEMQLPSDFLPAAGNGSYAVVDNQYGTDSFFASQWYSGTDYFTSLSISMIDSTGTLITGTRLPGIIRQSDFGTSYFDVGFLRREDGDQLHVNGTITAFSFEAISAVPEPSGIVLMLSGGWLLAANRKLKRAYRVTWSISKSVVIG